VGRKKTPISDADRRVVGRLLRDLRRAVGFRAVEGAAAATGCPASRQTIYSYERGSLTPSLQQFLALVEFYVLLAPRGQDAKPDEDVRAQGVAAVTRALTLPAYHVTDAMQLVAKMQPAPAEGRRRKSS
jgi:transcriptional regulator with XRE-family HTH domain